MPDERDVPYFGDLRTVEEVIAWLRQAARDCAAVAESDRRAEFDPEIVGNLRGRAEAFNLAAGLVEDVTQREQG